VVSSWAPMRTISSRIGATREGLYGISEFLASLKVW
jgi:hypothetical protein